jgi:ribonuclease Z
MHSTAREATLVAQQAGVKKLIIGHYSARIKDESILLNEAREVFQNTILAKERLKVAIL